MSRVTRLLAALLGGPLVAASIWMIVAPSHWFHTFPGVVASGAFNGHFVRDLGVAFGSAGTGFSWGAWRPERALPAVLAATAFMIGHACIHLAEASDPHGAHGLRVSDLFTVYLPASLSLACSVLWLRQARKSAWR